MYHDAWPYLISHIIFPLGGTSFKDDTVFGFGGPLSFQGGRVSRDLIIFAKTLPLPF